MERRTSKRFRRRLEAEVSTDQRNFTAFSENISAGGLFLKTRHQIPVGTRLDLRLLLPDGRRIDLGGDVRWALKENASLGRSGLGVHIDSMHEEFIALLAEAEIGSEEDSSEVARQAAEARVADAVRRKAEILANSITVKCVSCGAKNLLPKDRKVQDAKCGRCRIPLII